MICRCREPRGNDVVQIWEGKGKWTLPEDHKQYGGKLGGRWDFAWKELERFAADFQEQFMIFAKGSTYFFVMESGKVYMAKKAEKGERKLELVWADEKRTIVAIIDDQDRGKVFLRQGEAGDHQCPRLLL